MATCSDPGVRDSRRAVEFAERAVKTTDRKDPEILDTLAAAYAEAGDFAKAVSAEKEALGLQQDTGTAKQYRERLNLYESKTPYREPNKADSPVSRGGAAQSFSKDSVEGRYERPREQVFQAATDVVKSQGTILNDSVVQSATNAARIIEGKVSQRTVWVRVEAVNSKVTAVTVRALTEDGGLDTDLAHEIEKQIALKLVR